MPLQNCTIGSLPEVTLEVKDFEKDFGGDWERVRSVIYRMNRDIYVDDWTKPTAKVNLMISDRCVTHVGGDARYRGEDMFRFHNVNLTSLNFLHVTNISDYSFVTCKNLCYAHLPKVQKIGSYAFADCTRLKELTASHDLTTINYMAFFQCTRLSTVDVGPNVVVDRNAFSECDELLRLASLAKVSTDTGDYSRGGFNDPTRGVVKYLKIKREEMKK